MGDRIRGRKGQALLKQRRADHPLCAHCLALGKVKATAEIDHVVPLAAGGEDVDSNVQGLCALHHAIKSATESMSAGGAANHPEWLQPSRASLVVVTGPPCGGKSTLVKLEVDHHRGTARKVDQDLVIDLDEIAEGIRPGFSGRWDGALMDQAIRVRNAMLGSLARLSPDMRAWFIVSAPTLAEVAWWRDKLQPARMERMDPGQPEATRRAWHRRGRDDAEAVAAWYLRAAQPWRAERAKPKRQAFDADGYPIS